jgi:hypothetical protein
MQIEEIEILIGQNGQVELFVRGVKGPACLEITKPLEDSLGGKLLTREMKPEALDLGQPDLDQPQDLQVKS